MKVSLESTGETIVDKTGARARVWRGRTEAGVPVILYSVAVVVPDPDQHDMTEFADLNLIGHAQIAPDPPAHTLS